MKIGPPPYSTFWNICNCLKSSSWRYYDPWISVSCYMDMWKLRHRFVYCCLRPCINLQYFFKCMFDLPFLFWKTLKKGLCHLKWGYGESKVQGFTPLHFDLCSTHFDTKMFSRHSICNFAVFFYLFIPTAIFYLYTTFNTDVSIDIYMRRYILRILLRTNSWVWLVVGSKWS